MIEVVAQEIGKKSVESNLLKLAKEIPNLKTNVADLDKSIVKEIKERVDRSDIREQTDSEKNFDKNQMIDEKQKKAIAEVESGERVLETTAEKGNYGEMKVDQDLKAKGYMRISKDVVTDLDGSGHKGIDGVYYNENGKPQYLIVDAKYNTSELSETVTDGKQMSDNWIDKRLDAAVGKEMADKIRMEKLLNPNNVVSCVANISTDGVVSYNKLDGNANIREKGVKLGA